MLGRTAACELPPSVVPRQEILDSVRHRVADKLGREETERLEAERASLEVDDVLDKVHGWLEQDSV